MREFQFNAHPIPSSTKGFSMYQRQDVANNHRDISRDHDKRCPNKCPPKKSLVMGTTFCRCTSSQFEFGVLHLIPREKSPNTLASILPNPLTEKPATSNLCATSPGGVSPWRFRPSCPTTGVRPVAFPSVTLRHVRPLSTQPRIVPDAPTKPQSPLYFISTSRKRKEQNATIKQSLSRGPPGVPREPVLSPQPSRPRRPLPEHDG